MDLREVIDRRRMCRNFADQPVPPALVDRILESATRAPSAGHTQGWAFLVLEGPEQTGRFWQLDAEPSWLAAPDHPGVLRAPVVVVPLAHRLAYVERYQADDKRPLDGGPDAWHVPYWLVDTAFATMLLLLSATDEGLGALFFRLHRDPAALLSAFGVPESFEPLGGIALGWPAATVGSAATGRRTVSRHRPARRALSQVVHRGQW